MPAKCKHKEFENFHRKSKLKKSSNNYLTKKQKSLQYFHTMKLFSFFNREFFMIRLLKKSKLFSLLVIFINLSSLTASQLPNIPTVRAANSSHDIDDVLRKLFNEDGTLSYDAVLLFLGELENEELVNVYSEEDWDKINNFLIFLSKQGIMPDATEEEKAELEKDIQELLSPSDTPIGTFYQNDGYRFVPCIYYGQCEVLLCRSWFKKQCHHIAKFIKKHKTAVIVGTVLVVAAVAVVATVAIASSTAAASAAATAAADSSHSKSNAKKEVKPSTSDSKQSSNISSDNLTNTTLQQSLDGQISNYKNVLVENNLSISKPEDQNYLIGNERIIGSSLAHEALNNIPNISKNEELIFQGHGKIDNAFSTDQTSFYADYKSISNGSEKNLRENVFYFQGQEALKIERYDQAIDSFGKALEVNPNNNNIYLDRAFAYLETGEFDRSLNDYNIYNQKNIKSEKSAILGDCVDFSIGATTGITKGAVESGKQLLSFAGTAITHPIDTSYGIYEAFSTLAKLAHSQEWKALSESLTPEVCELVNKWETLSPKERGERSGYIVGKYGADILIPGTAAKAISQGVKGAKELAVIANKLQNTEKVIVLEALAETGNSTEIFTDVVYSSRIIKDIPHSSEILNNIKAASFIKTQNDILNIIKPNGKWIGKEGTNAYIRLFKGGPNEAMQAFKWLIRKGKLVRQEESIIVYCLPDDIYITYRSISQSGPSTIDIKARGFKQNIKIKFIEEK